MCGRKKSSAVRSSGVFTSRFLHSKVAASRMARASRTVMKFLFAEGVISSKARRCERDNGYNTHLARRLGLFQAHYMNDDWLVKGIRKRKREAIEQSTLSFLPSRS